MFPGVLSYKKSALQRNNWINACQKFIYFDTPKILRSGCVFTNYSQEESLSFSPGFSKLNVTQLLIGYTVWFSQSEVVLHSKTVNYIYKKIWRTRLRTCFRMVSEYRPWKGKTKDRACFPVLLVVFIIKHIIIMGAYYGWEKKTHV